MWPSPEKIPEALCLPPVHVDTVYFSPEATETNGFFHLSSSLNRTAVISTTKRSIQAHLHPDRGTGMDGGSSEGSEARFAAYVEALGTVLGHADRQQPMHDYCLGLMMPIRRQTPIVASSCKRR
jgi:hypothetical protein